MRRPTPPRTTALWLWILALCIAWVGTAPLAWTREPLPPLPDPASAPTPPSAFPIQQSSPVNDLFENRIPLTGTRITVTANNSEARTEPEEPVAGGQLVKTLWWSWTAPADGAVRIPGGPASVWWQFNPSRDGLLTVTRFDGLFDPYLELFQTNTLVGAIEPLPAARDGHSVWSVRAGQTYVLRLSRNDAVGRVVAAQQILSQAEE